MVNRWAMAAIALLCISFIWGIFELFIINYIPLWSGLATDPSGCKPTLSDPFKCYPIGSTLQDNGSLQYIGFPVITYSSDTEAAWIPMRRIFDYSIVLIAFMILMATFSANDNLMNNLVRSISDSMALLVCYTVILFFWAELYIPLNVTIPKATGFSEPWYLATIYYGSCMILVVGLGVVFLFRSFNVPKISSENQERVRKFLGI